ncbi:MAG: PD-(D/E)XK motif protein, partial [Gammaproteobacteria bacterium]
ATEGQCLVLALEQHVDRDLFFSLCNTLANALKEARDSDVALSIATTHLQRWKSFFASRKQSLLSPEEIRGLFAELQFLRSLYGHHLSEAESINSWYGPDRVQQDFVFGNTAVEVKAISGRERNTVRISSEDQLDSACDYLFLKIFRLSDLPNAESALSLNQAVVEIYAELSDAEAIETFSQKLVSYGYVELRDYDEPLLVVSERRTYRVENGFPRLIRSELPQGIRKVGYEIEIETLAPFECSDEYIWGRC